MNGILQELGLTKGSYALMTLHRPANVDVKVNLAGILDALEEIQRSIKIVLSIHPRTKAKIKEFGSEEKLSGMKNMVITEPLGYIKFMGLMINAKFVLTDSGWYADRNNSIEYPMYYDAGKHRAS